MDELFGLLMSMYVPGPGLGALVFLLQFLSSLVLNATWTVSSTNNLLLISSPFFLPIGY